MTQQTSILDEDVPVVIEDAIAEIARRNFKVDRSGEWPGREATIDHLANKREITRLEAGKYVDLAAEKLWKEEPDAPVRVDVRKAKARLDELYALVFERISKPAEKREFEMRPRLGEDGKAILYKSGKRFGHPKMIKVLVSCTEEDKFSVPAVSLLLAIEKQRGDWDQYEKQADSDNRRREIMEHMEGEVRKVLDGDGETTIKTTMSIAQQVRVSPLPKALPVHKPLIDMPAALPTKIPEPLPVAAERPASLTPPNGESQPIR